MESSNGVDLTTLGRAVERRLTDQYNTPVVLGEIEQLSGEERRNLLLRCSVREGPADLPASLIVKQVQGDYDPEQLDNWDTRRFFQDWVGAEFLSSLSSKADHGPMFYGGDRALGLIILEDMGRVYHSLVEPLLEQKAAAAEQALFHFVTRLGQMHADSIGQIERFERLAYPLHPQAAAALADPSRLIAEFRKLQTQLEGMISVETSFESELMAVITAVTAPGPFFTYIHGDPCPDNIFYNGDSLRLIDFEFGRFGSALLDAVYGRMTFPTCWCANRLPVALIHRLERAYRTELSRNCPAAQDDALFEAALVDACAYWLFVTLSWLFESALREDSQWGISTVRPRILARLEVFVTTAEQFRQRPALRRVVERLLDQLRRQWADTEPLPLYPAFRPSAD